MSGVHVSSVVPVTTNAHLRYHRSGLVVRRVDGVAQVDVAKALGADGIWTKNVATQSEVKIRIVDTLWTERPMPAWMPA